MHYVRPKFKSIYFVRQLQEGTLRIGETIPHRSVEIEDENGIALKLIRLMDGTRTIDDLWRELSLTENDLTRTSLEELILQFDEIGYLDNAESHSSLEPEEFERFKANLNHFSFFFNLYHSPSSMQERLKQARITIIGIGTLGSRVLFYLACLGVSFVRIIDFDVVERSNLNRQMLFQEQDIGRKKVDVAAEFIQRFFASMKVEWIDQQISSTEDVKQLVAGSDLVVLAADQPHIYLEKWVNEACMTLRIPFMGGGVQVVESQLLISEGKVIAIDFLTLNSSAIMNFAQRQPQCPVCGNL